MSNETISTGAATPASSNDNQIEYVLKQIWGLQVQQAVMLNSIRAGVILVAVVVVIDFVLRLLGIMR